MDGGLSQELGDGSCAHPDSQGGDPAWWSVDLASQNPTDRFIIENVTIYFRDDCCEGVLKHIIIVFFLQLYPFICIHQNY